uniref:Putative plasma membrane-associated cation-binding protein 1 n=1 Tax=Davidia involucrata TaxID=16924 RepID=A0A5B7AL93_DAVIN
MGYWKSKVLPTIKKVFEKNGTKKAAAAEACKLFDGSKQEYSKEFEEKKTELQPKVVEIYEASSVEIKTLVKEPKDAGLKKHSAAVQKFLDELVKIEFPGSKTVHEASSKYGPALVPGPILFVFEKVSTFIVTEEKVESPPPPPPPPPATATADKEETSGKQKEIVVEEEVVVVAVALAEAEKSEQAAEPEPPKVEEAEPPKP